MLFRTRAAAEPSPDVRARLAALFGVPSEPAAPPPPDADPLVPSNPDAPVSSQPHDPAASPPPDPAAPSNPGATPPRVRVDPGPRGALALAGVAVVALAVTGYVVWRARPTPVPVTPPTVVAATSAPALLVVDVAGDVRRPGLVRVPAGSRVADALAAAGGVRPGTSTAGLNLARKVVDGEQLVVGRAAPAAPASSSLVDLNLASADQLDALPGIGPVLADRIVEWRTTHGPFTSVDQLREVSGIGGNKFESLRELVTV